MLTLNAPLVERMITDLIDHPEEHNQKGVAERSPCGTVRCVAGLAVELSPGVRLHWEQDGDYGSAWRSIDQDGSVVDTMGLAEKLLGIGCRTAAALFTDWGDTEHIIGRLKDLLNTAGAR